MRNGKPGLLVRVLTEIGTGNVHEGFISSKTHYVHRQIEGRRITGNPASDVVDTLLHQAIHQLEPAWSERYVRNRTSWLMKRMSDEQIQALYGEYQKRVKRR